MTFNDGPSKISRDALMSMVKLFPFPMAVFTKDMSFVCFNAIFFELLGYSESDFKGIEQWFEMVYPDEDYREILRKSWDSAIEELEPGQTKSRLVSLRNGDNSFSQLKMKLYRDWQNYYFLTYENISELIDIEKDLEEQKEEYRILFEQSPIGIFHFNKQGEIERCNNQFVEILGSTREKLIGFHMIKMLKNRRVRRGILLALEGKTTDYYGPYVSVTSGKEIFIDLHIVPLFKEESIIGGIGIVKDVSEKYNMEMRLYENERKFRSIFSQISEGLIVVSDDGKIIEWNKALEKISGYLPEDIRDRFIWEFQAMLNPSQNRSPHLVEQIKKLFQSTIENISSLQMADSQVFEIESADGQKKFVENTLFPLNLDNTIYLGAVLRDVTKRIETEKALRDSEAQFRALFNYAGVGIVSSDKYGRILKVNKTLEKMLGYRESELKGKQPRRLSIPEEYKKELKLYREMINGKRKSYQLDKRFICKNGSTIWTTLSVTTIPGEEEDIALIGVLTDITQRKKYQEELIWERNKLEATLDNLMDAVVAVNDSYEIIFINSHALKMIGKTGHRLTGRGFLDIFCLLGADGESSVGEEEIRELIRFSERKHLKLKVDEQIILDVMVSGAPILDERNEKFGAVCVLRDITDQLKMEEELRRRQRRDTMEIMAGGIAHDFNNILTAVTGNVSMAALVNKDRHIADLLQHATKALNRARQLTGELLSFSKSGGEVKKSFIDLVKTIRQSVDFIQTGSNVAIHYAFPDSLWPVEADPGQIGQLVENISINAIQAMSGGGTLDILAENIDNAHALYPEFESEHAVRIMFKDSGPGIKKSVLNKMFEPFFTTKEKGTGLGLAIVYSIVQQHKGKIFAGNNPDKGAWFEIILPARPGVRVKKTESSTGIVKGEGIILLMDDEPMIRDVASKMLTFLGFEPVIASCGEDILKKHDYLTKQGKKPDLIILDITVPGRMGGKETALEFKKQGVEIPIVFSSGYANASIMQNYDQYGAVDVIAKPYRIDSLFEILYKIIPANFGEKV